jgi:hypothetical protein
MTASIAPRATFRDDREAPLWRARDGKERKCVSAFRKEIYFNVEGLTAFLLIRRCFARRVVAATPHRSADIADVS